MWAYSPATFPTRASWRRSFRTCGRADAGRRDEVRGRFKMRLPRRYFLHLAACAAALPTASRFAWAQAYPSRPVRIIVGFPGGSASDTTARLIGQSLSERLGQPFVIENRPGAASNLAAEAVVRAPPDGYTLLLVTSVNAINAKLYESSLSFDLIHDIAPVARLARGPGVMRSRRGAERIPPRREDAPRLGTGSCWFRSQR